MCPNVREPLTIEHALLGLLAREPMYGYQIHQQLRQPVGLGLIWKIKQSRLYALLDRLEADGLVGSVVEPQAPRPARRTFHLTPEGRATFEAWARTPVGQARALRIEFLAKLYFIQDRPEEARALFVGQRALCHGWLDSLTRQREGLPVGAAFDRSVWAYRIAQTRAALDWLDACECDLKDA